MTVGQGSLATGQMGSKANKAGCQATSCGGHYMRELYSIVKYILYKKSPPSEDNHLCDINLVVMVD